LAAKSGSRAEIHEWCCQGLRASSFSHRPTVEAETLTRVCSLTWRAMSGTLQRTNGAPLVAGRILAGWVSRWPTT
jgi:hypothetical protein